MPSGLSDLDGHHGEHCAEVTAGAYRAFRSGSNDDIAATLRSAVRHLYYPEYHGVVGARCARSP